VKFHAKYSGRTDLRERKRNGFTITAFDMVVSSPEEIPPWFEARQADTYHRVVEFRSFFVTQIVILWRLISAGFSFNPWQTRQIPIAANISELPHVF